MSEPLPPITAILQRVDDGDDTAVARLLESTYQELRALAGSFFGEQRPNHTLQPTALVHEAYAKLAAGHPVAWESRRHFFVVAGKAMRQILADHARGRATRKRGGDWGRITLHDGVGAAAPDAEDVTDVDITALDAALAELEARNARHAQIVELRFLAGLTIDQVADILRVSRRTVELDWRVARAWLRVRLDDAAST